MSQPLVGCSHTVPCLAIQREDPFVLTIVTELIVPGLVMLAEC